MMAESRRDVQEVAVNKYELDADLQNDRALAERVKSLSPVVDEVLGAGGSDVNVRWRLTREDPNRPFVVLNLSDWYYPWGVDRGFEPDELEDSRRLRSRLLDAVFDLRWKQFQKSVEKVKAITFDEVAS
jgi:hypothetical protein